MSQRLYYRPAEVSRLTGESLRTVWRRIREGTYRSTKRGGCRLVLAEDVLPEQPEAATRRVRAISDETRALRRALGL